MRRDYDGIKYYTPDDWAFGIHVRKAEEKLSAVCSDYECCNINEILELYNIQLIAETPAVAQIWKEEAPHFLKIVSSFKGIIARYFSSINDNNFFEIFEALSYLYVDDFWSVFEYYKTYKRVSASAFQVFLRRPETALYKILEHKDIVIHYGPIIAEFMRTSDQSARLIVSKYMEKENSDYYFPKELAPQEYETILNQYIDSDLANPNILQLIYKYQSTGECPIGTKARLKAKHAFDRYWEKNKDTTLSVQQRFEITFRVQDEIKSYHLSGEIYSLGYDVRWLEENLDYPTILNNFTYIFEMFDLHFRSLLVAVKSKISAIENVFMNKGTKDYLGGNQFNITSMVSSAQIASYFRFLKAHGIELEGVFKWFFEEYLSVEFNAKGFFMTASSPSSTWVERCRNLACEIDAVLKQFRMYVRDGHVDREEFEMSSEHLIIDGFPSLIHNKYAYPVGNSIQLEMFYLFSDQSMLGYTKRAKDRYSKLFELLSNEAVSGDDYEEYQLRYIRWLIDRDCLDISSDGCYLLSFPKVAILKDLYDHDVVCLYKKPRLKQTWQPMIETGDLRVGDTLFSEPERDYLNYVLNKAEYNNGLDLRNKYAHGTYSQDEKVQIHDYMELLKIMVLIITKINDEFCERSTGEAEDK